MKLSLAFPYPAAVLAKVSPTDRARVWSVLDAVSVNVLAPRAADLVADVRAAAPQIEIRTHSYLGGTYAIGVGPGPQPPSEDFEGASFTTPTIAKDRGRKDATGALQLRASAHETNGEAGLYRGKVRRRNARTGRPEAWHARQDVAALDDAYLDGWSEVLKKALDQDPERAYSTASQVFGSTPSRAMTSSISTRTVQSSSTTGWCPRKTRAQSSRGRSACRTYWKFVAP